METKLRCKGCKHIIKANIRVRYGKLYCFKCYEEILALEDRGKNED